jgi:hypothetical protein
MTTPKRNEAVALWVPNGHVLPDGSWEPGDGTLVFKHEASEFEEQHGFPLYPQSVIDALQGEVSRLRAAGLALLSVMEMQEKREAGEFHITAEAFEPMWHNAKKAWEHLSNLEPPTDGR